MGREVSGVEVRDGSIRLNFTLEGERHRKTLLVNGKPLAPTLANRKYAAKLMAEIKDKIRLGVFVMAEYFPASGDAGAGLTVGSQLDAWLAGQRIENSTKAGYASAIKFWKGAPYSEAKTAKLGDLPLRRLVPSQIKIAIASKPGLSGKTINNYVSVLRDALEMAVTDRVLRDNPVASIKRAKYQKPVPDPFAAEEREKIIFKMHERHPGQVANMVEFWFWTGLRTGEMFGLSWRHVDLASCTILVTETVVRGEEKDSTKTDVARTVRLNSRALAALQRQRQYTQMAEDGRVFHDPRYNEGWYEERAFRRSFWEPVLKALSMRYRRPYNCRHTYATAMLMAGMTPAFCAKQLGHSVEMFLKTYSKWIDGDQDSVEMARLEGAIVPGVSPASPRVPASA
jgi:integrase